MQSAYITLNPGRAVVVFDPKRVTAENMAQAVSIKTPFGAEVRSVEKYSGKTEKNGGRRKNCLILGFFCSGLE